MDDKHSVNDATSCTGISNIDQCVSAWASADRMPLLSEILDISKTNSDSLRTRAMGGFRQGFSMDEGILRDIRNILSSSIDALERNAKILGEYSEHIPPLERIQFLTDVINDIQCEVEDCKKCPYYIPGAVDKCNIGKKIATFLVNNGVVSLRYSKILDKSENK